MSDNPQVDPAGWRPLLSAPLEVIRRLKDPLLLAGMGAAVLIAMLAIFVPGSGRPYAFLIAGVIVVICLIWAVVTARRAPRGIRHDPDGNVIESKRDTQMKNVRFRGGRTNAVRSGRDTVIDGGVFHSGNGPAPRQAAPRDTKPPSRAKRRGTGSAG